MAHYICCAVGSNQKHTMGKVGRCVPETPLDPPIMYNAFQVQVKAGGHNYYVEL